MQYQISCTLQLQSRILGLCEFSSYLPLHHPYQIPLFAACSLLSTLLPVLLPLRLFPLSVFHFPTYQDSSILVFYLSFPLQPPSFSFRPPSSLTLSSHHNTASKWKWDTSHFRW